MNAADSDSGEAKSDRSQEASVGIDEVIMSAVEMGDEEAMDIDAYLAEEDEEPVGIDPTKQRASGSPSPGPEGNVQSARRTTVEDELEEPANVEDTYIEAYPRPAGTPKGRGEGTFEAHRKLQQEAGDSPWAPFESEEEWELGRWLMTSGVSQNKVNDFLKLKNVRILLTSDTYQNSNQNLIDSRRCQSSFS